MQICAQQLYDQLPVLRRYARALTGSTTQGDDLMTRCVEVALLTPSRFGLDGEVDGDVARQRMYGLLHLLFDEDGNELAPSPHPTERALASLPEIERRIYLLSTLEGLSISETARVMRLPRGAISVNLCRAREKLRTALTQRVLVVEDNPILAMEIEAVVCDMGHLVCGTAANERQALQLLAEERPTLALLDVRLAGGDSGVAIARQLKRDRSLRTIFVTAYDDDLELAEARHLGQLVRKPFTGDAIRAAISRAVFMPTPVGLA